MSVAANLTKLRATLGVLGLFCILPLILVAVLAAKIYSGFCNAISWRTLNNLADEVAVVSNTNSEINLLTLN